MTLERIRKKTQELHAKTRRELMKSIAGPATVVAICGFGLQFPNPLLRGTLAFAIAWSFTGLYFLNRGMWPAMPPGEAALRTSLDSYRHEVERRRSFFSRYMLCSFGPVIFAIATFVALLLNIGAGNRGMLLRETLVRMSPFLSLLAVWLVGFFVIRMRNQRELRREIGELDNIERENQSQSSH